jgi:hypothetical protein
MTYAPEHEKELLNRSIRCRMGVSGAPYSGSQQARTTENPQHPRYPQRHLLHPQERLRLAALALRVPALENRWTEMVIMEVLEAAGPGKKGGPIWP